MGTLFFILVAIIILIMGLAISDRIFHQHFLQEAKNIRERSPLQPDTLIAKADLQGLPTPIQNYLEFTGVIGKRWISYAHLKHAGFFRTKPNQKWMRIQGEYYLTTQNPSFVWYGKIKIAPLVAVAARDSYFQGKGNMLVKVLSLFTIAHTEGAEMDQSSFGRLLTEFILVPTAYLPNQNLRWEPIDDHSAKAYLSDSGLETSAIFYFDEKGAMEKVVLERFMAGQNGFEKRSWTGYCRQFREFHGLKIPSQIEGMWNLQSGDFSYVNFTITDASFE